MVADGKRRMEEWESDRFDRTSDKRRRETVQYDLCSGSRSSSRFASMSPRCVGGVSLERADGGVVGTLREGPGGINGRGYLLYRSIKMAVDVMLPHTDDRPPHVTKRAMVCGVAFDIALYLGAPESRQSMAP